MNLIFKTSDLNMLKKNKILIENSFFAIILILLFLIINTSKAHSDDALNLLTDNFEFSIYVFDINTKEPLQDAKVVLKKDGMTGGYQFTNHNGKIKIRNIPVGKYNLLVSHDEYEDFSDTLNISENELIDSVGLKQAKTVLTDSITVTAFKQIELEPIQIKTGNQLFDAETYHSSPASGINDLIQQNTLGAVKAPTGEVHIRGHHGEFTYYLDGVPVPLGVFGGLNEVVDPKVINRMHFITGGFPAEYGGQTSAVMDIETKVPSGHLHIDFSTYIGSFLVFNGSKPFSTGLDVPLGNSEAAPGDTLGGRVGPFRAINQNGQSLSFSNHLGLLGYNISMSRQETDSRINLPVPTLYNDRGTDYFLFGKFDYPITDNDYVSLNLNYGNTNNQVPFDMIKQGFSPDNQISNNAFQTLSWYHTLSNQENSEKNLLVGVFARQGGLNFMPSLVSPVNFQFANNPTFYSLTEDRNFNTLGMRTKYDNRFSEELLLSSGLNFSETTGRENFSSRDSLLKPGPVINTDYSGSDFGLFIQSEYQPLDWFRFDAGLRYDQHIAPDVSLQYQISPRLKLNFFMDEQNTVYLYYGKLFMPTNIEGIRNLSSNITTSSQPTLPERDDLFEINYVHLFDNGFSIKAAAYYIYASPGVDDQTIGSSAVKTPVNIENVHTTGIEAGLAYTGTKIPITGYFNASLIHAYGTGAITGGFLPITSDGNGTDLDHDQRLSISAGLNYQPKDWFLNITGIYGSGLTNGNPNNIEYGTGLFDFNSGAHVSPYATFNISAGYTFHLGGESTIEPSIYINNLFDNNYLLKGAYFSAANYGERRNVVVKLAVHV